MSDSVRDLADTAWQRPGGNGSAKLSDCLPLKFWDELGTPAAPDRLVRNLLGTTSLALIFGEQSSGKTFLAMDLGLRIALGRTWFGRAVTRGAVLYVAGEGVAGLNNRLAAFKQFCADLPADVPFVVVPVAINLGPQGHDAERVIAAAATIRERTGLGVVLTVIDTLARSMPDGDENSAADMGAFVAACDRIRIATASTVLIVHHSGKSQQAGARGSSALIGAVDTAIQVEKRAGGRVAKVVKQKDGADGLELGFTLEPVKVGADDDGQPITSCRVMPTDDIAKPTPKLTPREKLALDVLRNAIVDFGERPANTVTYPPFTLVKITRFRDGLKSAGVTDRDNPNNERSQWRRITTGLANKGVFAMRYDYCWPCDRA